MRDLDAAVHAAGVYMHILQRIDGRGGELTVRTLNIVRSHYHPHAGPINSIYIKISDTTVEKIVFILLVHCCLEHYPRLP